MFRYLSLTDSSNLSLSVKPASVFVTSTAGQSLIPHTFSSRCRRSALGYEHKHSRNKPLVWTKWEERFPLVSMKHHGCPVYPSSVVNSLPGEQLPRNTEPTELRDCREQTCSRCTPRCKQIHSKSCTYL